MNPSWLLVMVAAARLAPLGHDPDEIRMRAQDLLSRPPYRDDDPGLWSRLWARVGEWLAGFLEGFAAAMSGSTPLAWAIVAVGVLLAGLVVWRATRGLTVDRGAPPVPARFSSRTAAEWHADADAHAAAGELRDAVRCRYAAAVVSLIEAGTIEDVPGRTVGELDVEVASVAPALAEPIRAAGTRFDAAVYGREPVTDDDLAVVDTAAQAAGRLRSAAMSGAGR